MGAQMKAWFGSWWCIGDVNMGGPAGCDGKGCCGWCCMGRGIGSRLNVELLTNRPMRKTERMNP